MPELATERSMSYADNLSKQPQAFSKLIDEADLVLRDLRGAGIRRWSRVVFVGSGSSRLASRLAAPIWEELLGVEVRVTKSLPFAQGDAIPVLDPATLLVAVSQSGATASLVDAVGRAAAAGCTTIAVSASDRSPLCSAADYFVDTLAHDETIYAKTIGMTSTVVALALLAIHLGAASKLCSADSSERLTRALNDLPSHSQGILEALHPLVPSWASHFADISSMVVVGAGLHENSALEGALKILEVAKLPVSAYELEESMHGPFNALGPSTGVVLASDTFSNPKRVLGFLQAAQSIRAPTLWLSLSTENSLRHLDDGFSEGLSQRHVHLPGLGFRTLEPILSLLPMQVLALELAIARGVDPNATRYPDLYALFGTKAT